MHTILAKTTDKQTCAEARSQIRPQGEKGFGTHIHRRALGS